jgi:CRP/FNR family transcriptional regulator, cyclic AMP receptor protein
MNLSPAKPVILNITMPSQLSHAEISFSVVEQYSTGQHILTYEDKSTDVYFILKGEAQALNYNLSGRSVGYALLTAGNFFGELAALDELPRSATVVAKTDCEIAVLTGEKFNVLLDNYPSFNRIVLMRLVEVIRTGNERIREISLLGANQRICIELLRLAQLDSDNNLIIDEIPTQETFAQNLGISRETVIRAFQRLSERGAIERESRKMYIHDRGALETIALS